MMMLKVPITKPAIAGWDCVGVNFNKSERTVTLHYQAVDEKQNPLPEYTSRTFNHDHFDAIQKVVSACADEAFCDTLDEEARDNVASITSIEK